MFLFSQEQFISRLKELLSEIGHRSSNGCDAKPLSPVCNKDSSYVSVNAELMETGMEINASDIPSAQGSDCHEMDETVINDLVGEPSLTSESGLGQSSCNNSNNSVVDYKSESSSSSGNEGSHCLLAVKVSLTGEQ